MIRQTNKKSYFLKIKNIELKIYRIHFLFSLFLHEIFRDRICLHFAKISMNNIKNLIFYILKPMIFQCFKIVDGINHVILSEFSLSLSSQIIQKGK